MSNREPDQKETYVAEQSRAEQSRAEQSRAEQSRALHDTLYRIASRRIARQQKGERRSLRRHAHPLYYYSPPRAHASKMSSWHGLSLPKARPGGSAKGRAKEEVFCSYREGHRDLRHKDLAGVLAAAQVEIVCRHLVDDRHALAQVGFSVVKVEVAGVVKDDGVAGFTIVHPAVVGRC